MPKIISEELQSFVRTSPKIEKVHFSKDGRHYFNVFKLRKDRKDTSNQEDYDSYGTGLYSHHEVIPGIYNVDKKKEAIAKGDPSTLIVEEMTREEILACDVRKSGDSLVAKIANMSPAEKAMLREILLGEKEEEGI